MGLGTLGLSDAGTAGRVLLALYGNLRPLGRARDSWRVDRSIPRAPAALEREPPGPGAARRS